MVVDRRSRCVIVVLDGLGIGAMDDVLAARPRDRGANSLAHALRAAPRELPVLSSLGLLHSAECGGPPRATPRGCWGSADLAYAGADSYRGHLELMGGDASGAAEELFGDSIDRYSSRLRQHGHVTRRIGAHRRVLLVDGSICIADSLEADPGLNFNVTGALAATPFEKIVEVARIVRAQARVNRVIAVGGSAVSATDIIASIRVSGDIEGVDTAELGVYRSGVEIVHLGLPVAPGSQLQEIAASEGLRVALIGKAADLLPGEDVARIPAVETRLVFDAVTAALAKDGAQLIIANVQQLDLAGHQHDPAAYTGVLAECDGHLGEIIEGLDPGDCLILTGDHGNDPSRRTGHTRERVPFLCFAPGLEGRSIGRRASLADVGATAAAWLALPPPAHGTPALISSELVA